LCSPVLVLETVTKLAQSVFNNHTERAFMIQPRNHIWHLSSFCASSLKACVLCSWKRSHSPASRRDACPPSLPLNLS
jgi:hypothetical protein